MRCETATLNADHESCFELLLDMDLHFQGFADQIEGRPRDHTVLDMLDHLPPCSIVSQTAPAVKALS